MSPCLQPDEPRPRRRYPHGAWVTKCWLAVLVAGLSLTLQGRAQSVADYHQRADQALQSFLLKFWSGEQQYFRHTHPDSGGLTGYWTYANAWLAVMDGAERTGGEHFSGMIESLYLGQDERGWYSGWYDDECWMTLALIRAFDLTGELKYLARAEAIYADVQAGWDAQMGGVWWDKAHTQKATASNAGAALAGALLYQRTRDASYRSFAEQVYAFWITTMVDARSHQVCDHILPDGTRIWWRFTYNEGLMIGAGVELHRATRQAGYLVDAHRIAGFLVRQEVIPTVYGDVLYDGDNTGCGGDCHQFKGPAYRYLMGLYREDPTRASYAAVLQASADAVWQLARDPATTVFSVNWAGPAQASVDLGQDNAACMALSLYADQAGPYPGSGGPPNRYEAEDAVVHRVELEADYGAFTGWGYASGWRGDGEWVRFTIDCAVPGPRMMVLRYAAGAGRASRQIVINGVEAFANLDFAGTRAWSTYFTNRVPCHLPAGPSTIEVRYESSRGSTNWLNLDHLVVEDVKMPHIASLMRTPTGGVTLAWTSVSNQTYRVQTTAAPAAIAWSNLTGTLTASGPTTLATDFGPFTGSRHYRIVTP